MNTFVRVFAEIPRDWPRAKASETPSMLTANAKLLQIFAAYDKTILHVSESSIRSPKNDILPYDTKVEIITYFWWRNKFGKMFVNAGDD